jgi:ABC-type nitrate/sulfonate/bicarbonate transport system substrate-binding protein
LARSFRQRLVIVATFATIAACADPALALDKVKFGANWLADPEAGGYYHTLLSDYGYSTYATLIETRRELVEKNPDLVQRFVDASAIGWYHYIYRNNFRANEQIRKEIPISLMTRSPFGRGDEEIRGGRFRRFAQTRHWGDD